MKRSKAGSEVGEGQGEGLREPSGKAFLGGWLLSKRLREPSREGRRCRNSKCKGPEALVWGESRAAGRPGAAGSEMRSRGNPGHHQVHGAVLATAQPWITHHHVLATAPQSSVGGICCSVFHAFWRPCINSFNTPYKHSLGVCWEYTGSTLMVSLLSQCVHYRDRT